MSRSSSFVENIISFENTIFHDSSLILCTVSVTKTSHYNHYLTVNFKLQQVTNQSILFEGIWNFKKCIFLHMLVCAVVCCHNSVATLLLPIKVTMIRHFWQNLKICILTANGLYWNSTTTDIPSTGKNTYSSIEFIFVKTCPTKTPWSNNEMWWQHDLQLQ